MEQTRIYSNRCWLDGKLQPATVTFANGIIVSVSNDKLPGANDAGDHVLMPGVIDAHVHVNEPGRTAWEGFATATAAAVAGGITSFADMPLNASPVTTSVEALQMKIRAVQSKLACNVVPYGGLVPENANSLEPLLKTGIRGIKCFLVHSGIEEFANVSEQDLAAAMPAIAAAGIPLLAHCEWKDEGVEHDLASNPGRYLSYLGSRPKRWENKAVSIMIEYCRRFNCPVHIVHVSSAEALPLIKTAKAEGLPLTAETCPHYIFFDAETIPDNNTLFKCAPPIRERENNELLKQALIDGVLDFIATDHSPAPPEIKQIESGNLQKAWGGIAGLQFLLPVSWTSMRAVASLGKFIPWLTKAPAGFLKLASKGEIKTGHDADFVIWAPEEKWTITAEEIRHKHKPSPYTGSAVWGKVKQTWVNAVKVYDDAAVVQSANQGKIIL